MNRDQRSRSHVTDQQLNEYEALAKSATPGPWSLWRQGQPAEVIDTDGQSLGRIWQKADAEFIVAARTAVVALVDEVRLLRFEAQEVRDEVRAWLTLEDPNFSPEGTASL